MHVNNTLTGLSPNSLSQYLGGMENLFLPKMQGLINAGYTKNALEELLSFLSVAPPTKESMQKITFLYFLMGGDSAAFLDWAYRLLSVAENDGMAHKMFAVACSETGLMPLAIGHAQRATQLLPKDGNAWFWLGVILIRFGQWQEGWAAYEKRPTQENANGYTKPRPSAFPEWQGEDLHGRSIAVLGEDGHGDQIMHFRFVRKILDLEPERVVLDVRSSLARLFLQALSDHPRAHTLEAIPLQKTEKPVDFTIAFGSMASRFGANADNLPMAVPYLVPSVQAERPPNTRGLRVGIVWRGMAFLATNAVRSTSLATWKPLFDLPNVVQWVSLQHGDHTAEEDALLGQYGIATPLEPHNDYLDTANIIANLDLVIGVDTSVIHLASAMGKPVWLLNRATGEWRWGWKNTRSPWYPNLTIFNQTRLFEWQPVFTAIRNCIMAFNATL